MIYINNIIGIISLLYIGYFLIQNNIYKYLKFGIKYIYEKKIKKIHIELDKKIYFIKDGEEIVIYNLTLNKIIKNTINENIFNISKINSDFILVEDNNNIIRYMNFDDYINNKVYTTCKKLFMKLKLIVDDKVYLIDLNNPNYYIINNILFDIVFLKWYCKNNLNFILDINSNYYIIILDNSIQEYKLNKFNSLKLLKNNFEIINNSNLLNNIN